MQHCRFVHTPVGTLRLISSTAGLVTCEFVKVASSESCDSVDPCLLRTAEQVGEYFAGKRHQFELDLDWSATTDFSRRVLQALQLVPYGTTITYGELAERVGSPGAARAVGRVMAKNPFPIIIPCHRVMGRNGAMTGYSGGEGIATKQWLLSHENQG